MRPARVSKTFRQIEKKFFKNLLTKAETCDTIKTQQGKENPKPPKGVEGRQNERSPQGGRVRNLHDKVPDRMEPYDAG